MCDVLEAPIVVDDGEDGEEIDSNDVDHDDDDDDESSDGNGMDDSSGSEEGDDDYDDINFDDSHINDEIVDEFILTFSNGGYDAEFNEALDLDRIESVPLPNQPTQVSYNKPDNWVERNQTGLTKVRKQLLTYIDKVLLGTRFKLELTPNDDWYPPNEESIVWHEPILDRYWDVLEAEIDRRKQWVESQILVATNYKCRNDKEVH
jgi:hypothetical protein